MRLHRAQAGYLAAQGSGSKYIKFADPAVEAVLMAKGVSSDGIGITVADAEAVTSIGKWFNGNTEITSFDEFEKFIGVTSLSGGNNATNAISSGAFYGCTGLYSVKFPANLQEINGGAFVNTGNLDIIINIPTLRTLGHNVFKNSGIRGGENLGTITNVGFYGTTNWGGEGLFYNCDNLKFARLPVTTESIADCTFYSCGALNTLICEATTPPSLGTSAFRNTPIASGTGYIYVPDASVDAYKAATNWATYADQIKPLSEYTE